LGAGAYILGTYSVLSSATNHSFALSLHAALPICRSSVSFARNPGDGSGTVSPPASHASVLRMPGPPALVTTATRRPRGGGWLPRSEEHTSELQSRENLVCRLLLEKKKIIFGASGQ